MANTLQDFFKQVGKSNLLTREEEVSLSKRIEAGDKNARRRMIQSNLRLAISIAKKYQNKGCDLEDLIQESSIGLIKAVDRFDWRRGFKFSTYACWWIKQAVRRHVASHSSAIRLPSYAKNMLWKMRQASEEFEKEFGSAPTQEELAELLGVTKDTMESILACASTPLSLDTPIRYSSGDTGRTLAEVVPDNNYVSPDDIIDKQCIVKTVRKAFDSLTDREEKIMRMRFGISDDPHNHTAHPITKGEIKLIKKRSR
jgi:RNA polymerase primary sigma factor